VDGVDEEERRAGRLDSWFVWEARRGPALSYLFPFVIPLVPFFCFRFQQSFYTPNPYDVDTGVS
jgi:hypothetical protein